MWRNQRIISRKGYFFLDIMEHTIGGIIPLCLY